MKTILYTLFFLLAISFTADAQSKIDIMKKKKSLMMPTYQNQNLKGSNDRFRIKINPYWQEVDAPHTNYSYVYQVKVPAYNVVWGAMAFDTAGDANRFLRTVDGGKTWLFSSIPSPANSALGSISAIDGKTCYATTYDATDYKGGGLFKTTDGGATWKQLGINRLFFDNSFVDFVYFFNARKGIVIADNDGTNTSYLIIYTTCDAGKTWQRIPTKNMQPTIGSAYSSNFDVYAVLGNTIWVKGYDDQGNNYIFRSDDLGQHWESSLFNIVGKSYYGFDFEDKMNGLMVGLDFSGNIIGSYLAATHDGGKTWAEVTDYKGYVMGLFVTVIPGTHTYVSTTPSYVPVYGSSYSRDGGKTWNVIDSGTDRGHSSIEFLNPLFGWTGRGGSWNPNGGMFKWKLHFMLGCDALASDNNNAADLSVSKIDINNSKTLQLFPNPAKDKIVIQGLNPSLKTTLSLFNISGRLIQQSIANGENYQLNIQKLAAGSYYIKIETDKSTSTLKFVKE